MKYLKRVILKNFQSHKYSTIELDEGLNVIVGPSDSGKSAIIRGIKWALYNEPLGDYYIREGETEASVTLEFSNNIKVERLRNKSRNAYILYNREGDEIVFEGFGNKVPQEIIDILAIKKIPLDSNETNAINLGEQLEGAFLLSEKGSIRASAIGRLVGVNLIDDTLKDTLRDIRSISFQEKSIVENVGKIEKELKTYEYLDDLKVSVTKLQNLQAVIKEKMQLKNKLLESIRAYTNITEEKKYINNILSELKSINILETNIYRLENKIGLSKTYVTINTKLNQTIKQIIHNEELLKKLINTESITNKINIINESLNKRQVLIKIQINLDNYKKEIKKLSILNKNLEKIDTIQEQATSIEEKTSKFNELNNLKIKFNSINRSLKIGTNYIETLQSVDMIETYFNNLSELTSIKSKICQLSMKLGHIKTESNNQNKDLIKINKELNTNLETYENIFIRNEFCPFCLSPIDEHKIEHIVKNYN